MVSPHVAIIIGFVGGAVSIALSNILLKLRLDDVVDAVPVHLGSGIWGTLAIALLGPLEAFGGASRLEQLGIQSLGILTCGVWAFGTAFLALSFINWFYPLRVSPQTETIGLNYGEHGLKDELIDLMEQVDDMRSQEKGERPVYVDRASDKASFSLTYNHMLEAVSSEYRAREENLLRMANLDPLTGMPNLSRFDEVYEHEWSRNRRRGSGLGLILIDVDHFKLFNDKYGHNLGDYCLQNICKALSESLLRASDVVARIDGEEFAAIIPNTTPGSIMMVAEKLRSSVAALQIPHEDSPKNVVTISLGVSYVSCGAPIEKSRFFEEAAMALRRAKSSGRNRAELFRDVWGVSDDASSANNQ